MANVRIGAIWTSPRMTGVGPRVAGGVPCLFAFWRLGAQCQIRCQIGGFRGGPGDFWSNSFSKLLTGLTASPGSSPSLSIYIQWDTD